MIVFHDSRQKQVLHSLQEIPYGIHIRLIIIFLGIPLLPQKAVVMKHRQISGHVTRVCTHGIGQLMTVGVAPRQAVQDLQSFFISEGFQHCYHKFRKFTSHNSSRPIANRQHAGRCSAMGRKFSVSGYSQDGA